MNPTQLIDAILASPSADSIYKTVAKHLETESEKRLTFYKEITEQVKAEFINGKVIFHSPVKKKHNVISKRLCHVIDIFVELWDLGFLGIEKLMVRFTRNDYEPDICFFKKEKSQHFTDDQMLFPPPDFIVEILSPSTQKRDRGIKFEDYANHGVEEYWMIDPETETIEQYILEKGKYTLNLKTNNGMITSLVIKNFTIPIEAIFNQTNILTVLEKLPKPN